MTSFDAAVKIIQNFPRDARGRISWAKDPRAVAELVAALTASPVPSKWLEQLAHATGMSAVRTLRYTFDAGKDSTNTIWPELREELVRLGVSLRVPGASASRGFVPTTPPHIVSPTRAPYTSPGVPGFRYLESPPVASDLPQPATQRTVLAAGLDLVVTETRVLVYGTDEHKAAFIEFMRDTRRAGDPT